MSVIKHISTALSLAAIAIISALAGSDIGIALSTQEGIFCNAEPAARFIARTAKRKKPFRIAEAVLIQQGFARRYTEGPEATMVDENYYKHVSDRLRMTAQWCEWDKRKVYVTRGSRDGVVQVLATPSDQLASYWHYMVIESQKAAAYKSSICPLASRMNWKGAENKAACASG